MARTKGGHLLFGTGDRKSGKCQRIIVLWPHGLALWAGLVSGLCSSRNSKTCDSEEDGHIDMRLETRSNPTKPSSDHSLAQHAGSLHRRTLVLLLSARTCVRSSTPMGIGAFRRHRMKLWDSQKQTLHTHPLLPLGGTVPGRSTGSHFLLP